MLKEFVWNAFEYTGSVESYMFFKELEEKGKAIRDKKIAEEEAAISNM